MNNFKFLLRPNQIKAIALTFLVPLAVYLYSASPAATGYADSGELILMGALSGVTHPSGYPMATALTGLAIKLLPLKPSYTANLLAGVLHAVTIFLIYHLILIILFHDFVASKKRSWIHLSSLLAALILAFSPLFWLYSSVIEVVAFTSLLTAGTLYAACRWYLLTDMQQFNRPWFLTTWILAGLGLSHIQTFVLLFPGLLYLMVAGIAKLSASPKAITKRLALGVAVGLTAFLIPLVILWFSNASKPPVSWYFPQTLSGLTNFITRQDYTGYFIEEGIERAGYIEAANGRFFTSQPHYFLFLHQHFGSLGLLLGVLGLTVALYKRRPLSVSLGIFWLVSGPILSGIIGIPDPSGSGNDTQLLIGVLQRQLVISEISFALLIGIGVFSGITWITKVQHLKNGAHLIKFAAILLIFFHVSGHALMGIQRDNTLIETYANDLLESAEPDSVIICSGDIACFALLHASLVDHIRPDVEVLTKNVHYRYWYLQQHPEYYPLLYTENPDFLAGLVSSNLPHRPVYFTQPDTYYADYIGLEGNPFYLIPHGLLFQVSLNLEVEPKLPPDQTFRSLATMPISSDNYFFTGLKQYFSGIYNLQGFLWTQFDSNSAQINYERAATLTPDKRQSYQWLNLLAVGLIEPVYVKTSPPNSQTYVNTAAAAIEENRLDDAYAALRKASYVNPTSADIRVRLAQLLISGGYPDRAVIELQHALIFNPEDVDARRLLEKLQF